MLRTLLISTLMLLHILVNAQDKQDQIQSARVAFISEKLSLSPAVAQKFWPVYNEYWAKKTEIRKNIRILNKESEDPALGMDKLKANLQAVAAYREKEAALEKEYLQRFLLILNARQVHQLYNAERDFIKVILKKISDE